MDVVPSAENKLDKFYQTSINEALFATVLQEYEIDIIINAAGKASFSNQHAAIDLLVYTEDQADLFADITADIDTIHVYNSIIAAVDPLQFPDPLMEVRDAYSIPPDYFMVSNLLAPTKNLEVVIMALGKLKRKGLSIPVVLISQENVREEVIMLGLIPRIRQKQLLANAVAIIQPSRFEGWNTLVEEAKWMNKEIILSDIPVHLEQAAPLAVYFKDNDADDLAARLQAAYTGAGAKPEKKSVAVSQAYLENINRFASHFMHTSLGE
ncbi:glycosyltransferase, group 1 family protein [Ostertagia ostertagi]